jgi:hypothetical protein
MEYVDLECTEVLTLESLAVEMARNLGREHLIESLLSDCMQGRDATAIAEAARNIIDAAHQELTATCIDHIDAAGFGDLDAADFGDLDAAGFSDFYGAAHEDRAAGRARASQGGMPAERARRVGAARG